MVSTVEFYKNSVAYYSAVSKKNNRQQTVRKIRFVDFNRLFFLT